METLKACVVCAASMQSHLPVIQKQLQDDGFTSCIVITTISVAVAARDGESDVPKEILDCINGADLCIFLIPEDCSSEPGVLGGAGVAVSAGKRILVVREGAKLPSVFEEHASAVLAVRSTHLASAIRGQSIWEGPDGAPMPPRKIDRIKCQ